MQYARLGDTGLIVSRLAFGAMTFQSDASKHSAVYKVDEGGAEALVNQALDGGVNFFNTANGYAEGDSERVLGRALKARRSEAVIATKLGMRTSPNLLASGLSRQNVIAACEASLKRLGTDYIDVYLCHRIDPYTPIEETVGALDALVRSGKVRYVGFSNWPAWMAAKAVGIQRAHGYEPFRAAEMYYSLVGRDLEHEVIPFCDDAGVGIMVWSPLGGGFLSGKYTREDPTGGGGRLDGSSQMPFDRERGYDLIPVLKRIAEAHGVKPAAVALAWLLTRPAVSTLLVGASRPEQLAENLAAVDVKLTPEELTELDKATRTPPHYPQWFVDRVVDDKVKAALG